MSPRRGRIRVIGTQRRDIDINLLAQALLMIAKQPNPGQPTTRPTLQNDDTDTTQHPACSTFGTLRGTVEAQPKDHPVSDTPHDPTSERAAPGRDQSLGQYLEHARQQRGMSLRALAAASDVPMSTVNRLLKDQVTKIRPPVLTAIAKALSVPATEVFRLAGVVSAGEPSDAAAHDLEALLRTRYGLPEGTIAAIRRHVDATRRRAPHGGGATDPPVDQEATRES